MALTLRKFGISMMALVSVLSAASPLFAGEISRKILALHDQRGNKDLFYSPTHHLAEMPLNHLGMEVIHRSVDEALPDDAAMASYRGVLTWFRGGSTVKDKKVYCEWLSRQMDQGRKLVIVGNPGIFDKEGNLLAECRLTIKKLGADYLDLYTQDPFFIEVVHSESEMMEFERKLMFTEGLEYSLFKVTAPQSRVYLKAKRRDQPNTESDLVFTTPQGGFVHPGFVFYEIEELEKSQWRINPFRFFEEGFALKGLPRPDATTINGRRIFYSHIDGDGIFNHVNFQPGFTGGEIIHDHILKRYEGLPLTISIITGYLDLPRFHDAKALKVYKDLFSPPNVEPASHGYAHPLVWNKGTLALEIPGYSYNSEKEIKTSVEMVNKLLADLGIPKKTSLFLWTGDCLPNEEALKVAQENGILNINGGDSRFDRKYDSYSFVMPLGLLRHGVRQIYSSAPNENIYTNLWTGPYYGFRDVIDSFINTESPYRLKPINIYYHFYSGEKMASLKALHQIYDFSLSQPIFPVFASDYVRIVQNFFKVKIEAIDGGFRIREKGTLRTIRFDREPRYVDMARSKGVLGFTHHNGSLYVSLDGSPFHDVFLAATRPTRPYVENTSFDVLGFQGGAERISFQKKGWYRSEMVLAGLVPGRTYRVQAGTDDLRGRTDAAGRLAIMFSRAENGGAAVPVTVTLQ